MRQFLFKLGIIIVGFLGMSCDCEEEFMSEYDADLVLEGKVMDISPENEYLYRITFATEEGSYSVLTPKDEDLCGFPFDKDESYIVFAYYNSIDNFYGEEGTYYTTICSFTMSEDDWEDLFEEY